MVFYRRLHIVHDHNTLTLVYTFITALSVYKCVGDINFDWSPEQTDQANVITTWITVDCNHVDL